MIIAAPLLGSELWATAALESLRPPLSFAQGGFAEPSGSLRFQSPSWAVFSDGHGVAFRRDLTYAAVLQIHPPSSRTDERSATALRRTFATLSRDVTLQLLYASAPPRPSRVSRSAASAVGFVDEHRSPPGRRCLLALALTPGQRSLTERCLGALRRLARPGTVGISAAEHEAHLARLRGVVAHVLAGTRRAGISVRALQADELRIVLRHPLQQAAGSRRAGLRALSSSLHFAQPSPDTFHLGERLFRVLSLTLLPAAGEASLLEALLLRLPPDARFHALFEFQDRELGRNAAPRSRSTLTILLSTLAARPDAEVSLARQVDLVLGQLTAVGTNAVVVNDVEAIPHLIATLMTSEPPQAPWAAMTAAAAADLLLRLSASASRPRPCP